MGGAGRRAGRGSWLLQGRLAAFTCLLIIHAFSSHRLILASQFTSYFVFQPLCPDSYQPSAFIRIPEAPDASNSESLFYKDPNSMRIAWSDTYSGTFSSGPQGQVQSSGVAGLTSGVMYWKPVQLRSQQYRRPLSFSTTFQVLLSHSVHVYNGTTRSAPKLKGNRDGIEWLAFINVPDAYTVGQGGGLLGFLNSDANASSTTSAAAEGFGVEIDFHEPIQDPHPNHVGIGAGNMTSVAVHVAETTMYRPETTGLQVWIEYHSPTSMLEIRVASWPYPLPASASGSAGAPPRPDPPTLAEHIDLSNVLLDFMHIGLSSAVRSCEKDFSDCKGAAPSNFSCSREVYVENWCFHTFSPGSNASVADCTPLHLCASSRARLYRNRRTTTSVASVLFLALVAAASLRFYFRWDDRRRWKFDVDANIEEGPHRFSYKELKLATLGFSPKQSLGRGGFGSVYKGFLPGNQVNVAVKRVAHDSKQGENEFLAEVQIIGKVRHRHLVRLQGWCHERGELLLVYDYLPGGSLDSVLFKDKDDLRQSDSNAILFSWENRWKTYHSHDMMSKIQANTKFYSLRMKENE